LLINRKGRSPNIEWKTMVALRGIEPRFDG
jgi:hypothetical protein